MEKIDNIIKDYAILSQVVSSLKKDNKKIVTTNGVFDILHYGHVSCLKEAKSLGDVLIVAINSDDAVKKLKGKERLINNENARAEVLSELQCVDYVAIFPEDNPKKILSIIKPDVHAKGSDYNLDEIIEKDIVESNGGKIVLLKFVKGFSTTDIIEKIKRNSSATH